MTTTMVETFDAQMLDYQNDDYSMHVSTSDTWFHDEAIMEDDGLPIDDANVSIEVDMEPYDEDHNTEYEMADGSEHYDPESTELLDVEVYDASRATTPTPILAVDTPALPPSDVADDSRIAHEFIEPLVSDHSPLPPPTELPETSVTNDNALVSDTAVSSTFSPYPRPAEELTDVSVIGYSNVLAERSSSPSNAEINYDHSVTTRPSEATAVATEQIDFQDLADSGERDPVIDEQGAELNDLAQSQFQDQPGADEGVSASSTTTHPSSFRDDTEGVEEHDDYESSAVSSGDPHEISEGVFIDPPPAVLLSFVLADQPETCLFNAPPRPEVPSPTASEYQPDIPVLLAHRPILYYEPLSSVFEALRQDEHLSNIPELMNAELALDAYDLEMVLSEDNIDAREVSLHDLNVLHDGLNNSGPLRLRLQTTGPRFIVQYRMLREHVAQLNISEANDGELESSGEISEVKQVHIQHNTEENTEGLEEDERNSITDESIDQKPQEAGRDETPQEAIVETHQVVSTTHEQEQHSSNVEELEHQQEHIRARELEHVDTLDHKNESLEESTDEVGHEAESTILNGDDIGQEEKTGSHINESHDDNGEALLDQDSAQASEGLPRDALRATEDVNGDPASALNRTPRSSETHFVPSNTAGNNKQHQEHSDSHLDTDDLLKGSDSGLTNFESFPDIDVSEFDLHPEQETNEIENQTSLAMKENLSVTGTLDHESAGYEPEVWDDDLDGEGDPDTLWEHEQETASNQSSITLSSKTSSKRSISQAELEEDHEDLDSPPHSPGLKRPRVQ